MLLLMVIVAGAELLVLSLGILLLLLLRLLHQETASVAEILLLRSFSPDGGRSCATDLARVVLHLSAMDLDCPILSHEKRARLAMELLAKNTRKDRSNKTFSVWYTVTFEFDTK